MTEKRMIYLFYTVQIEILEERANAIQRLIQIKLN